MERSFTEHLRLLDNRGRALARAQMKKDFEVVPEFLEKGVLTRRAASRKRQAGETGSALSIAIRTKKEETLGYNGTSKAGAVIDSAPEPPVQPVVEMEGRDAHILQPFDRPSTVELFEQVLRASTIPPQNPTRPTNGTRTRPHATQLAYTYASRRNF